MSDSSKQDTVVAGRSSAQGGIGAIYPIQPPIDFLMGTESPEHLSFSGHQTFPFRYTWLPKGVHYIQQYPDLFARDDAMVILGVGKNMVDSIRHWCETLRLIEVTERGRQTVPTQLGQQLLGSAGWDPYMEDPATLWLLHWILVSRRDRASTWYLAFTRFSADIFRSVDLRNWLLRLVTANRSGRVTEESMRRDVEVFLRTYCPATANRDLPFEDTFDCPLVELGLIQRLELDYYRFARGPKPTLPDAIFIYALLDYWRRVASAQQTMTFETILRGPGSPGAAFKLSENALVERLEGLPDWSRLEYDDTAGLRVVLRRDLQAEMDRFSILGHYYRSGFEKVAA